MACIALRADSAFYPTLPKILTKFSKQKLTNYIINQIKKGKKNFPTVLLAKRWRALQVPNDELPVGDWQVQRRGLEILLSGSLFFVHQLELQSRKLE